MALSLTQTAVLGSLLKPGMRIASMGYPDLIAPEEMISKFSIGYEYRTDSEVICKRHGLRERPIPDAVSVFNKASCELDVYDIVQERGCEILCDLNDNWDHFMPYGNVRKPCESASYDIVLDVGTVEHCFNIAQAIINMAGMVKEGGYILHENPHNCSNHGFYSLNPTWYHDFYAANGFKLLDCRLVTRTGASAEVPITERFRGPQDEANVFALAQRMSLQSFVFPVQSRYRGLIAPAAGAERAKEQAHG